MDMGAAEGIVRLGGRGALARVTATGVPEFRSARRAGRDAGHGGVEGLEKGEMSSPRQRKPASRAGALEMAAEEGNADRAVTQGAYAPMEGSRPRAAVGAHTSGRQGCGGMGRTRDDAPRGCVSDCDPVPAESSDERAAVAGPTAMIDTVVSKRASDGAVSVSSEENLLGALVGAAEDESTTSHAARRRQRRSATVSAGRRGKQAARSAGALVTAGEDKADRPLDDAGFATAQEGERAPRVGARSIGGTRGVERIAGHTTRLRQLRFAKVLAETCNVAEAAVAAGRTMATVHRWRSVDAAFAAAWDEALAIGYDRLENALLVYAIGKVDAVAGGVAGASISNGDLQLAVGMLQRHRAADSGRRGQVLPVKMPTEAESDAALKRALDGLARRGAPS